MTTDELEQILQDVARHSDLRSIATTRAELAARLQQARVAIPSESWLDALAREAVHGRSYVLDTHSSPSERRSGPALGEAIESAPAHLSVATPGHHHRHDGLPGRAEGRPVAPSQEGGAATAVTLIQERLRFAGLSGRTAPTLVLVALVAVIVAWRRCATRSRAERRG